MRKRKIEKGQEENNNIKNARLSAETKGITLVALVITIVILIILSTITINAAFGEGGLIEKAQQAKNLTEQAVKQEQDELNRLMEEYNSIIGGTGIENPEQPEVPKGTITFDDYEWQGDGTATIKVSTTETGYTLQYQVVNDGKEINENSWTNINTGETIADLIHGDTVYARLWNGTDESDYANADIRDDILPQPATINLSETTTDTENSVTATVTLKDNESGVNVTESKWTVNTTSGSIGTNEQSYTNNFKTNSEKITIKNTTAGTYYLHVLTKDVAGNKLENISQAVIIEEAIDEPFIDDTIVEAPEVGESMIPIKYVSGIGWVKTEVTDKEWYDYGAKKWANIVLGDATFNNVNGQQVLNENQTYSMLVWIPRYAYRIRTNYHTGTAGRIDIVFIDTNNKDKSGTTYSTTYPSASTGGSMSNYVVHPAFTYDGKQMAGFWVAKFETSQKSNGTPQIKAGAVSWRNIEIGDAFLQCANMNSSGNAYNLSSDSDPHLLKNTEWGAIAYLTQNSTYGRGGEVGNNSNSSFYTGGGSGTTYRNSTNQSTTGNVTGVYDLKGGAWEFTAAFLGSPTDTAGKELTSADSKYYESYTQYGNQSSNGGHYGEAMYETSSEMPAGMFPSSGSNQQASWYGERSMFPWALAPYIVRGGDYAETDGGLFSCSFVPGGDGAFSGDTFAYTSFRVAIPCYNGILDN